MSWQLTVINTVLRLSVKPILATVSFAEHYLHFGRVRINKIGRLIPVHSSVDIERTQVNGVPGEWIVAESAKDSPNVLLYLHGGGYIACSPSTHRSLTPYFSRFGNCKVLAINYRKAPEFPYPAALEDSIEAYHWLLDNGYKSQNIMLAGDSAGGNLTLTTLLKLRDEGRPLPVAAMCLSPWTDLTCSGSSHFSNRFSDPMLPARRIPEVARMVAGDNLTDPHISPLHGELHDLPPILLFVGSTEVLLDDGRRFAEKAAAAGVDMTFKVWNKAPHVFPLFAPYMPEANRAIREMCKFMGLHLTAGEDFTHVLEEELEAIDDVMDETMQETMQQTLGNIGAA